MNHPIRVEPGSTSLPRWRVVLDFGLQFSTVYVREHNSIGAGSAAVALAGVGEDGKKRCVAIEASLAADQSGPVDVVPEPRWWHEFEPNDPAPPLSAPAQAPAADAYASLLDDELEVRHVDDVIHDVGVFADVEGWGIFNDGEIHRDDERGRFASDAQAIAHVERCAGAGSVLHGIALAIHARALQGSAS